MNLHREEFMKTLSTDELADYADLEKIWDENWDKAFDESSEEEIQRVINTPLDVENEPRFINIIEKLKQYYSKLNF